MHISFTIPEWLIGVIGTVVVGYIIFILWIKGQFR